MQRAAVGLRHAPRSRASSSSSSSLKEKRSRTGAQYSYLKAATEKAAARKASQKAAATHAASHPTAGTAVLPLRVVESPTVKSVLPALGHAAYISLSCGFLMTDILALRTMLVGGYSGLVLFHALHPRPLRIPLGWSAVFVVVNAGMACMLASERLGLGMSDADEALYQEAFSLLTRGQFRRLLGEARAVEYADGVALTRERVACAKVYFILDGEVTLYLGTTARKSHLSRGGFVNDVAFQQGEGTGAYGTIVTSGPVRVLEWDCERLRRLMGSEPSLGVGVHHILTATVYKRLLPELREAATAELRRASERRTRLATTPTGGLLQITAYPSSGAPPLRARISTADEAEPMVVPRENTPDEVDFTATPRGSKR